MNHFFIEISHVFVIYRIKSIFIKQLQNNKFIGKLFCIIEALLCLIFILITEHGENGIDKIYSKIMTNYWVIVIVFHVISVCINNKIYFLQAIYTIGSNRQPSVKREMRTRPRWLKTKTDVIHHDFYTTPTKVTVVGGCIRSCGILLNVKNTVYYFFWSHFFM